MRSQLITQYYYSNCGKTNRNETSENKLTVIAGRGEIGSGGHHLREERLGRVQWGLGRRGGDLARATVAGDEVHPVANPARWHGATNAVLSLVGLNPCLSQRNMVR